ncbi:MAG TPA: AI-2E family transporter [Dokdonella sp.]
MNTVPPATPGAPTGGEAAATAAAAIDAAPEAEIAEVVAAAPPPATEGIDPVAGCRRLLGVIVAFLVVYTCVLADVVLVPILVAILIGLVFAPAVRLLERWRIPRVIGSLLAIAFVVTLLGTVFGALAQPAREWAARAPRAMTHLESSLRELRRPLQAATKATEELGKLATIDGEGRKQVVDTTPSLAAQAMAAAPALIAEIVVTIFLAFLFLLHGDGLLRKFVTLAPHLRAKRDLVAATRQAQHELSLYMITITLINAGLGIATAIVLYLLGVPDPLLWGGIAALLNYAPFIGPLVTAVLLAFAGFVEFSSPWDALAGPAAFLVLHTIEGQVVTPHLVGRRLALDPVMVLLALVVLGWAWGATGLLIAVPLLSCAKIIAERMPEAQPLAILLSR